MPEKLILVQTFLQNIEIPQVLFVFGGRGPCCAGRANSQCSSLRNRRPLYTITGALWFRLQKIADFRSPAHPRVPCGHRDCPVATQHGGQCSHDACRAGSHPCRAAEACSHRLDCSADHRHSPVAVRCQVVDVPLGTFMCRKLRKFRSWLQASDTSVTARKARFPLLEPLWSTWCCMATTAPHGGEGSDACAHGGDMSSRASQWQCPQPPTSFNKVAAGETYDGLWAQKMDRAREAANKALRRQKSKAAGDVVFFELFDEDTALVRPEVLADPRPQERVQRHTVEHIVDFVCFAPMCRSSTLLCRRRWNSCRTSSSSSTRSCLIPSTLSKCPRSCPRTSLCSPLCAFRSWRNSWWKCRRSFPIPRYSGLWSRTSSFQFLIVDGETLVFKVFFPDRVQQRLWC